MPPKNSAHNVRIVGVAPLPHTNGARIFRHVAQSQGNLPPHRWRDTRKFAVGGVLEKFREQLQLRSEMGKSRLDHVSELNSQER